MKREIKFRIWDKSEKEWTMFAPILGRDYNNNIYEFVGSKQQRDNYIIQQYTGLKDVNGKEIYEGDIVKTVYEGDKSKEVGVVVFDIDTCSYRIRVLHFSFPIITYRIPENSPATLLQVAKEVIGNILEHPDLISVDDVI